jgi:site-specific recombinase XerC
MVATAPDKLAGLRDQALLLIGFGGALRSSELVALNVWNISRIPNPDRISLSFERP